MKISKEEMNAIMSLAQKIIKEQDNLKKNDKEIIRSSEDYHDMTDYMAPEKCEGCND